MYRGKGKQACKVLKLLEDVNGLYMFEKVGRKSIVTKYVRKYIRAESIHESDAINESSEKKCTEQKVTSHSSSQNSSLLQPTPANSTLQSFLKRHRHAAIPFPTQKKQ